jgi:hypothetical protein
MKKKIQWSDLAHLYKLDYSNIQIAVAMQRCDTGKDATKTIRTHLSMLLKNGYTDGKGNHVAVERRDRSQITVHPAI